MLLAALRRFATLLAGTAGTTAAVSALGGAALGSSFSRAISVGFYGVGSFLLVAGFFVGNRGPVRLKDDDENPPFLGMRFVRWASPEEREETINSSAIFVVLGLVLILLGVAVDGRYSIL